MENGAVLRFQLAPLYFMLAVKIFSSVSKWHRKLWMNKSLNLKYGYYLWQCPEAGVLENFCDGASSETLEGAANACYHIQSGVFEDCRNFVSILSR